MLLKFENLKGIYLISPENINNEGQFLTDLEYIFSHSNISLFQLRIKNQAINIEVLAMKVQDLCLKYNVLFVLNDDIKMAKKLNCIVHIGKNDGQITTTIPCGVSCYNNYEYAIQMAKQGAWYVSFGAFFQSSTKPEAVNCSVEILKQFKQNFPKYKVSVIGGINSSNVKSLIAAGADFICICSAVWNLKTNKERVDEINKII